MTQTANNYGEVLFELGIKKDTVEESKKIFSLTEQLHRTLKSPIISKNEKYSIIEKVFPKEIENFLKVVCDHEKMSYIDEIIEAYYKKYNEANNILTATLSYVVEPNENQLSQIKNYLAKKYNKETVEITMIEQPELIGGFVLKVGDIEEDNSIRGRLNRLEKKLTWR